MPTSSGSRKGQSRITFTPLPSSSPAAKDYNKQTAEKAAAISYQGSPRPAKRRKVQISDDEDSALGNAQLDGTNGDASLIPTPAASVEQTGQELETEGEDEQPIRSTQRRSSTLPSRRKQSKQQPLEFSGASVRPHPSSVNMFSPVRPSSSARPGFMGTQTQRSFMNVSSDELDDSDTVLSPHKPTARQKKTRKAGRWTSEAGRDKPVTRSSQKPLRPLNDEPRDGSSPVRHAASNEGGQSGNDEEDMPTTAGTQRRRRRREARESSFISSSPQAIESDDDLQVVEKPTTRRLKQAQNEEEEDDDAVPVTPCRRKLKQKRRLTQQEQEDLDEDLNFLEPSSDIEHSTRAPRSTQTAAKTAKQKALESLKRRRSGQPTDPIEVDEEDEGMLGRPGAEFAELYDDSEDDPTLPPISSHAMFHGDKNDADFLAEDDGEHTLGIPQGLPLAFTRFASMRGKELFKYAVEWMVQKRINPAFQMDDEIYDLTFKKLDDEVKGLAGSKFTSAAWTPEFTRALQSRPDIAYEPIDRTSAEHFMRDKCDACNRSGHPATYQIQFQGKPYNRDTLEEVAAQDDEDEDEDESSESGNEQSDDEDNRPAYDAQGREVAPASTIYYVGKFCMSNATTSHALNHWRYHLNEWVVTWLIRNGYNTPAKLVERDRWSTKKRRKYANKIADKMEAEGVVKTLWKEFRGAIDEAVNSKQRRYVVDSP